MRVHARTHTHTHKHTHRGTHTHKHSDHTKLKQTHLKMGSKHPGDLEWMKTSACLIYKYIHKLDTKSWIRKSLKLYYCIFITTWKKWKQSEWAGFFACVHFVVVCSFYCLFCLLSMKKQLNLCTVCEWGGGGGRAEGKTRWRPSVHKAENSKLLKLWRSHRVLSCLFFWCLWSRVTVSYVICGERHRERGREGGGER